MDIDDDGHIDLPVANWCVDPSWVYWGPDFTQRSELNKNNQPEMWSNGMFVADIDGDSNVEITVANEMDWDHGSHTASYIFSYAGNRSFTLVDSIVYPYSCGAQSMQVADLNNDGFLDIIIANYRDYEAGEVELNSFVFLGPGPFFSKEPDYILPTHGGHPTSVADLNGDRFLDIVFSANASETGGWNSQLIIYYGPDYSVDDTAELPVCNNWENQVVDLNKDGYLDIVVVNGKDNTGYHTQDRIYWGPDYSVDHSTELPGVASSNITVADMDLDGNLDLLISNWGTGVHGAETLRVNSYIIYGPDFDPPDRIDSFPTLGAHGNLVADFNDDGLPDFFMGNEKPDWTHYYDTSYIFYNSPSGFDFQNPQKIQTHAANDGVWTDLGDIYQREPVERYLSGVLMPQEFEGEFGVDSVRWWARVPPGIKTKLWLRVGDCGDWGPWIPLENGKAVNTNSGCKAQFRLDITTDYKRSSAFSFDSIKIFYRRVSAVPSGTSPDGRTQLWQSTDGLRYHLENPGQLAVYDVSGKLIMSRELPPSCSKKLKLDLKTGVYLLVLRAEGEQVSITAAIR